MKIADLLRITALFRQMGWPIEDDVDSAVANLFERYCRMCARLDSCQRSLVLDLSRNYRWMPAATTSRELLRAWRQMVGRLPPDIDALVVAPVMEPDSPRSKSHDKIFYEVRGAHTRLKQIAGVRELRLCATYNEIGRPGTETAIVLVDDYVGTGKTADKAIAFLLAESPPAINSSIYVLAIAAQRSARITAHPTCTIVAGHVLDRGISDNADLTDPDKARGVMRALSQQLGQRETYWLGYEQSEALITLTRTPNNTFPVFWTTNKVGDQIWDAPFPR